MRNNSLQTVNNCAKTDLQLNNDFDKSKALWVREAWENATWENFFTGERDSFLFNSHFDLPKELKEMQRLFQIIKNMQSEIEIGTGKEIDFLAITILMDACRRLYIENSSFDIEFYDDFIHPYNIAFATICDLWSVKRREFILEQIIHYLGDDCSAYEDSISKLKEFSKGKINLQSWEIYSLISDLPTVYLSGVQYNEIQQNFAVLSNFNILSINFHATLRDRTNMEKQGADIMHNFYGITFDSYGAYKRLIHETSKDIVDEAELEESMISALSKKFVKRNYAKKSTFNVFLSMLGTIKGKNQTELPSVNMQLNALPETDSLESRIASLALRNQNKQ